MKNIKYITILLFQFAILQFTFGQQTADDNGRPVGTTPSAAVEKQETPKTKDVSNGIGENQDFDIPDQRDQLPQEDTYYPLDFDIAKEEIFATTNPTIMAEKMNDLNDRVEDLLRITEELRLENKVLRESMSNCCSTAQLGLSATDAYLLQNAPNPFVESSEIRYFVPQGLNNTEIRFSNIKGEVLSVTKVAEAGYGKILVDSEIVSEGTFIYTLVVNGEIIDSKVMIKK